MKVEIKHRLTAAVLFSLETDSVKLCVEAAVKSGAYLDGANLRGANLRGAYLRGANLDDANLDGANLDGANLDGANLDGANLRGAYLRGANLGGANLGGAYLGGANLGGANLGGANLGGAYLGGAYLGGAYLRGANLGGANLGGAYLGGANLTPIRDDIWAVLSSAPAEVEGLRQALVEGRVDGSTYTGECACLVGTIANICQTHYEHIAFLKPNSNRPAERWFLGIKKGDTPDTNQFSQFAVQWIDQWLTGVKAAFGSKA